MPNIYLPGVIQIPSALDITDITQANPAVITVSETTGLSDNTYMLNMLVKISIPVSWGMQQANGKSVKVLTVAGNNITVNMDSTRFDPFADPSDGTGPASLAPNGSRNLQYSNKQRHVPFRSLNNVGN